MELSTTSKMTRAVVVAIGMSVLGNVVIMSVVPVRFGVRDGSSIVTPISIPPS